jgi:hypothetical protein
MKPKTKRNLLLMWKVVDGFLVFTGALYLTLNNFFIPGLKIPGFFAGVIPMFFAYCSVFIGERGKHVDQGVAIGNSHQTQNSTPKKTN